MTDRQQTGGAAEESPGAGAKTTLDSDPVGGTSAAGATNSPVSAGASNALTPEEQMALFEKELKENDWGHQPC